MRLVSPGILSDPRNGRFISFKLGSWNAPLRLGLGEGRFSRHIKEAYGGYSIFHCCTVFALFVDTDGGVNDMGIGLQFIFEQRPSN